MSLSLKFKAEQFFLHTQKYLLYNYVNKCWKLLNSWVNNNILKIICALPTHYGAFYNSAFYIFSHPPRNRRHYKITIKCLNFISTKQGIFNNGKLFLSEGIVVIIFKRLAWGYWPTHRRIEFDLPPPPSSCCSDYGARVGFFRNPKTTSDSPRRHQ